MEKILKIEGMSCSHCESRVQNAVMALDGVVNCKADANANQAVISYDEQKVNESQIVKAIEAVGYNVKAD